MFWPYLSEKNVTLGRRNRKPAIIQLDLRSFWIGPVKKRIKYLALQSAAIRIIYGKYVYLRLITREKKTRIEFFIRSR